MKFKADVGVPLVAKVGVEFDAEKALEAERRLGKRKNPLQAETLYQSAFKALEYSTEKREDKNSSDIIVFVDDLDRCTPGKAVYLLESIKLILSQPGFVFVLALDPGVVEGHLKKRYAEECVSKMATEAGFTCTSSSSFPCRYRATSRASATTWNALSADSRNLTKNRTCRSPSEHSERLAASSPLAQVPTREASSG
jgi:hypothetical protein